jgi:hypothetical protein
VTEKPAEKKNPWEVPEEYLVFARVPETRKSSRAEITEFLEEIANLLSDEDQQVYVEDYMSYNGEKKPRTRDKGSDPGRRRDGGKGNGATSENPAGGHKSALYPMYVCHGKF